MASPQIRLTYFNGPGRAEASRLALAYGNVDFTDERLTGAQWGALKASDNNGLPFGQLPALTVDGQTYAQSVAVFRYCARLAGLYPSDPLAAARVDMIVDGFADLSAKLAAIHFGPEEAKPAAVAAALADEDGWFAPGAAQLQALKQGETFFAADNQPTHADIMAMVLTGFAIGVLGAEGVAARAPVLMGVMGAVAGLPGIAEYRARRAIVDAVSDIELVYFDSPGRMEVSRNALRYGGVCFTDTRLSKEEFVAAKAAGEFPFGQVPALRCTINGERQTFGQSISILRFCGKLSGLYPSDPLEALFVDQVLDGWVDVQDKLGAIHFCPDEAKKEELKAAATAEEGGWLAPALQRIDALVRGDFFTGASPSIADLVAASNSFWIGMLFGPAAMGAAPAVGALAGRVAQLRGVREAIAKMQSS